MLGRTSPRTVPLGGGTLLSHGAADSVEVVDLQALGLGGIAKRGNMLAVGATATLQSLLENESCPTALKRALKLEAPLNLRDTATVAGCVVTCDGRSPFVTTLLALDAELTVLRPAEEKIALGRLPTYARSRAAGCSHFRSCIHPGSSDHL